MVWNFILYLLYGLAFFTLGVAILFRDIRFSELGIARILWLLAFFGIVHGFHEWLEFLEYLEPDIINMTFSLIRLGVISLSFLFLLYFGIFINLITFWGDHALKTTPRYVKALIGVSAFSLIVFAFYLDAGTGKALNTRLFIAFPGGMLAGIGLIMYSRTVRTFSYKVAINFIFAGSFMICYALLSGVLPSDVIVPFLDVRIILFRGVSAFFIMFFTIKALSVFSLEQRELINERLLRFSQSEKLTSMGILAAGIAHEINNPLTNVSLNLEMLRDLVQRNDTKVNKKLDAIERNVDRASKIAKELLHFSSDRETVLQPTNINHILRSVYKLIKNQKHSSAIRLSLQDVPDIMGISWKLEEVFINLLMNSLDACGKGGSIEIESFADVDGVQVMITDTGHGICEEDVFKVFDPFYTTKEIGKGTGLGLSVCYNIIQQHGGKIVLVSNEQDGTLVAVTFPMRPDEN